MPKPRSNETKDEFISRCIPKVIEDGTADDTEQAAAICNSIYESKFIDDKFKTIRDALNKLRNSK